MSAAIGWNVGEANYVLFISVAKQKHLRLWSLEAPQASGKSFAEILTTEVLKPLIVKDEEERQKERDFDEQIKIIKLQGSKNTKGERDAN